MPAAPANGLIRLGGDAKSITNGKAMDSDIRKEDVGQETEKILTGMNLGQFSMLLDDISVVEALIPKGDHGLTLKALCNLIYREAGKRSIDGYEKYAQVISDASISPGERAAHALHDHGLKLNATGNVVPIFPPNGDKAK